MKVTVDNLDGLGAVDYSQALVVTGDKAGGERVKVIRKLNEPSLCRFAVAQTGGVTQEASPICPARNGRVVVTNDAGTVLFTG